ncbi:La-related protein 6 [Hordeum vulgare]|nr:La-related protein 6 [Hordeum vulgare]
MQGPTTNLLYFALKNLPSLIAMEPVLSFLKDTFYGGGSASSADKSVLIDYANKGTLSFSSMGKEPIHDRKGTP